MDDLDKPAWPPFFSRRSARVVPALSTYLVLGILNAAVSEKENEGVEQSCAGLGLSDQVRVWF